MPTQLTCSYPSVIPEIDIWRAATLMLKRYGEGTRGKRHESRRARGTGRLQRPGRSGTTARAIWRRITEAVTELANMTPPGALH